MNAPQLLQMFEFVYGLSITGWLGAILFFSFGVAPIIFKVLDPEPAARFVRALFPRYYAWIAIFSVVSLAAFTSRPLVYPELRAWSNLIIQGLLIINILLAFYCGNSLTPAINKARDAGEPQKERFNALHKRSVWVNSVMMLIGLACLAQFESRIAPKTMGIIEMPIEDRVERDRQFRQTLEELLEKRAKKAAERARASEAQSEKSAEALPK